MLNGDPKFICYIWTENNNLCVIWKIMQSQTQLSEQKFIVFLSFRLNKDRELVSLSTFLWDTT